MVLAPVVQKMDSAIHRINHYPVDSVIKRIFRNTYNGWIVIFSGGQRYPTFEQPGPEQQFNIKKTFLLI